jgi:hypothetical protein
MPIPLPTTWTKRSAPPSTSWLDDSMVFRKRSDGFYIAGSGLIGGLVPSKRSDNFIELAGTSYRGDYLLGRRSDDFIEARVR